MFSNVSKLRKIQIKSYAPIFLKNVNILLILIFLPSNSPILGSLLRLYTSRHARLASISCCHSIIICLTEREALLQSSQWGATSGTSLLTRYPCVNKVRPSLILLMITSSLREYFPLSINISGSGLISLSLSLHVSHHCFHSATAVHADASPVWMVYWNWFLWSLWCSFCCSISRVISLYSYMWWYPTNTNWQ